MRQVWIILQYFKSLVKGSDQEYLDSNIVYGGAMIVIAQEDTIKINESKKK